MRSYNNTTTLIEKAINEIVDKKGDKLTDKLIRDTCKKHDVIEGSVKVIMGW